MIELELGDITRVPTDAIVNAANAQLSPGGGVSGAIHAAGGPRIEAECREIVRRRGPLPTGEAVITTAGRMPSRWVVHVVGPVWNGGNQGEADLLAAAYRSSVAVADEAGARTIAFPSISTGIFGYPVSEAAPLALRSVREAMEDAGSLRVARFVLYDEETYSAYGSALAEMEEIGDA